VICSRCWRCWPRKPIRSRKPENRAAVDGWWTLADAIPVLTKLVDSTRGAGSDIWAGRCYFESRTTLPPSPACEKQPSASRLGEVHFFLGRRSARGNFGEAIVSCGSDGSGSGIRASLPASACSRGKAQYLPDALAALETAVRLDPRRARAVLAGEFHRGLGELTKARPYFDRAYRLDPESRCATWGRPGVA